MILSRASVETDAMPTRAELTHALKSWCRSAGFELAGVAAVTPGLGADRLREWLASGKQGEMLYMDRQQPAREDPNLVLPGAQSVLVVALSYRSAEPVQPSPEQARISRYAWGEDYHRVVRRKLKTVATKLRHFAPNVRTRIAVDSAPVVERDYARLAGLGWFGKNTLLLNQRLGSWFFLGCMLLDCQLDYDPPNETDHCGTCRRCLDACPTQAFDGPYQLDPRRCISYLTIEHKSPIPPELASSISPWVFGCDVCQDVCPWNEHAARGPAAVHPEFLPAPGRNPCSLDSLLEMRANEFHEQFHATAVARTGRDRLVRNALLAAANSADPRLTSLATRSIGDDSELVRATAVQLRSLSCSEVVDGHTIPTTKQDA